MKLLRRRKTHEGRLALLPAQHTWASQSAFTFFTGVKVKGDTWQDGDYIYTVGDLAYGKGSRQVYNVFWRPLRDWDGDSTFSDLMTAPAIRQAKRGRPAKFLPVEVDG